MATKVSNQFFENLVPKEAFKIFDAYVQAVSAGEKVPVVTLLVRHTSFTGEIAKCDLQKNRLVLVSFEESRKNAATFIEFGDIAAVTLHDSDICKEFLKRLAKA